MPNAALTYQSSSAANLFGWGYQAANHLAEQVYSSGWGALGTLYVPRTVLYTAARRLQHHDAT